ncbi:MAG: tryptophan-rich sensory protein [Phycisphaeraceae bacterium]|nr:tryptophan-rich sensory protein [Phycisphaeraceae bacterium]
MIRSWLMLGAFLMVTFAAAAVGARFMPGSWYEGLDKPWFTPPGWVFGPVWTVLYVSMAVAAWLAWRKAGWSGAAVPLALFGVQLILNAAWTWLFFGLQRPELALIDVGLLWVAIRAMVVTVWPIQPWAGSLWLVYLAWTSFASVLNAGVWWLNR